MSRLIGICAFVTLLLPSVASAHDLRLDLGLTASRFEQQVKTEIGGIRGERLVEETEVGVHGMATWRLVGPLELGIFSQFDMGTRQAGRFVGFEEGATIVEGEVGGDYSEFWLGPLTRVAWKGLFAEVGYGLVGIRSDDARSDLATAGGDTETALRTSPTVAWLVGLGGALPVWNDLHVVLRIEYRVRYYDSRGSEPLTDEIAHGTQNLTPFFGVAWLPELLGPSS